jgi:hypothetical protein
MDETLAVGQVFKDNDWRSAGRFVRVEKVSGGYAEVRNVVRNLQDRWEDNSPRTTRIKASSFFRNGGRGFSYVDG